MSLAVVADGDPHSVSTNSGVARGIYRALEEGRWTSDLHAVDASLKGASRVLATVEAAARNPRHLRAQFRFGATGIWLRSATRDRALAELASDPHVLHVRNVYLPSRNPYTAFIDSTTCQKAAEWDDWLGHAINHAPRIDRERRYYSASSLVVTAGEKAAESAVRDYGVPEQRVEVVGAGLDNIPSALTRAPKGSSVRVLFVGREFNRKGGPELVEAVRILRDSGLEVECDVVGPHTALPYQPGVTNHGWVGDRDQLAALYRRADIFCLPALHEPFGRVVLEAMSYELPCIVSTVGELPRLVAEASRGLNVEPGSVQGISEAIRHLALHPQERLSMGRASRLYVMQFTWAAVAERILSAWERRGIRVS